MTSEGAGVREGVGEAEGALLTLILVCVVQANKLGFIISWRAQSQAEICGVFLH